MRGGEGGGYAVIENLILTERIIYRDDLPYIIFSAMFDVFFRKFLVQPV